MGNLHTYGQKLRFQLSYLELEAKAVSEHKEEWRDVPVIRDSFGRFGSKSSLESYKGTAINTYGDRELLKTLERNKNDINIGATAGLAATLSNQSQSLWNNVASFVDYSSDTKTVLSKEIQQKWDAIDKEVLAQAGVNPKQLEKRLKGLEQVLVKEHPALHPLTQKHIRRTLQRAQEITKLEKRGDRSDEAEAIRQEFEIKVKEYVEFLEKNPKQQGKMTRQAQELTELSNQYAVALGGKQWRVDTLNAEIKYGDKLDAIASSATMDELKVNYNHCINSLKKRRTPGVSAQMGLSSETEQELKALLDQAGFPSEPSKLLQDPSVQAMIYRQAKQAVKFFSEICPVKLDVEMGIVANRGFRVQLPSGKNVMNLADGNPGLVIHELGHMVETSTDERLLKSIAFRTARTTRKGLLDMWPLGMPEEKAVKDEFTHPYIGKVYPGNGGTEVISMGIESTVSPEALFTEVVADREHILMTFSEFEYD